MGKQSFDKLGSTPTRIKFNDSGSSSDEEELENEMEDESDHQESSSEEEEVERELADVSFEELQKARSNGFHVLHHKSKEEKKGGRANKNRPMEISSKKPVGRYREVIQQPKKVSRDPRFEDLCGTLNTDGFKKRYNFLYETQLPAEKEELVNSLKKTKDPNAIADMKNRISLIEKQLKAAAAGSSKHETDRAILTEHKKKEREAAKQGKQPYYIKKSEVRKQALIAQYERLKAAGKLEAFIEKKRRKNAAKDHRYMPYRRPNHNE